MVRNDRNNTNHPKERMPEKKSVKKVLEDLKQVMSWEILIG